MVAPSTQGPGWGMGGVYVWKHHKTSVFRSFSFGDVKHVFWGIGKTKY